MKKPQWITVVIALLLVGALYFFGRTVPRREKSIIHTEDDGHEHTANEISIDSIITGAKSQLSTEQVARLSMLENSISRGDVKEQKIRVYHQLSHFWSDSMRFFPPYGWYEAEAARLENSEKTLTFAAHLFLEALQREQDPQLLKWEARQAKDLFERSLKINPENDSSKVGLGACYLFGNISPNPMEGVSKIMEVIAKDSTDTYAQITLAKGSMLSGQSNKAISRLLFVNKLHPDNIEAILLLAEVYERENDKATAVEWYRKSLSYIKRKDARMEIENRITELSKKP